MPNKDAKNNMPLLGKIANALVLRPLFKYIIPMEIRGLENLPKESGALICGNHIGIFDAASIIQKSGTKISFLGKKELENTAFGRFAIKAFDIITVDRKNVGLEFAKKIDDKLENGELVGIFPEGTKRGALKGKALKHGAITFFIQNDVPIIPVAFNPNLKIFQKNYINIGRPIYFKEMLNGKELNNVIADEYINILFDEIIKLLDKDDQKIYLEALAERNNNILENKRMKNE